MNNKGHLTTDGLEEIRKLKGGMNTGRSLLLPVSNQAVINKAKLPKGIYYYSTGAQTPPGNVILIAHFFDENKAATVIPSYFDDEF
jgi:hypothetical protein